MNQASRPMIMSTLPPQQESAKRSVRQTYVSPKLVAFGDVRGITMGSGSKGTDTDFTETLV